MFCASAIASVLFFTLPTLHDLRSQLEHLKPPKALILSAATNQEEAWQQWKMSWVAGGLDKKDEKIQVATLFHVLGKECVGIYKNFVALPRFKGS